MLGSLPPTDMLQKVVTGENGLRVMADGKALSQATAKIQSPVRMRLLTCQNATGLAAVFLR